MGTSSPHPGSNDRSPLVPPHADAEPDKPLPKPIPQRFRQFRTNLGRYVQTGDKADLNNSLRSYVQQATGGAEVGPRRFGTTIATGSVLLSALAALSAGQEPADLDEVSAEQSAKLSDATGKPLSVAIEILADALAPVGEESDKIREVLVHALSESLQGLDDESFEPEILDEETYAEIIICFLAEAVFQDIILESGQAFGKISSPDIIEAREDEIRETIKVAVDKHLSENLGKEISNLSISNLREIQLSALKDVFAEWDGLE